MLTLPAQPGPWTLVWALLKGRRSQERAPWLCGSGHMMQSSQISHRPNPAASSLKCCFTWHTRAGTASPAVPGVHVCVGAMASPPCTLTTRRCRGAQNPRGFVGSNSPSSALLPHAGMSKACVLQSVMQKHSGGLVWPAQRACVCEGMCGSRGASWTAGPWEGAQNCCRMHTDGTTTMMAFGKRFHFPWESGSFRDEE